ncbi:MAG: molybdate ABC transporter permease subunit [Peptococcaceae bacterium]
MLEPIFLSLRIASIATVFSFFLGVFLAYILNKRKIPGKNFWETLITLPMILPPSVTGYFLLILLGKRGAIGSALIDLFGFKIIFTWYAAVIAASIVSLPLMYQNVKAAFLNVDPSYERAARTLGSSEFRIFWTITFPLAWPGIISGIVLSFCRAIGEFGATLMVAGNIPGKTQTVPTAIYYAVENGNSQLANTLVLIMTVFSFVLILTLNKWLEKRNYLGK